MAATTRFVVPRARLEMVRTLGLGWAGPRQAWSRPSDITPWPQEGWRPVQDGVSGGRTSGVFKVAWGADGRVRVTNTAVKDGDYAFAHFADGCVVVESEINRHACGGQKFCCDDADIYILAGMTSGARKDDVSLADFHAFKVPKSTVVHLNADVWHCPPFVAPEVGVATILTEQAAVHSKIYYDPVGEDEHTFAIEL